MGINSGFKGLNFQIYADILVDLNILLFVRATYMHGFI
jgi:hypothetical protein